MLRVLTLNTGLTEIRLFGAALYEDVPHVPARAAHLAPALRGVEADIVLLQELVPQRVKVRLAAELRDLYPHGAGIAEDSRFYGTGLLTLSRHPMTDASCIPFAQQTLEEGLFGPRGMLACAVSTPDLGRVRVINLHATAGGAYRRKRRRGAPDRRSAQIAQAIEAASTALRARWCSPATSTATRPRTRRPAGSCRPPALRTLPPVCRMTPGLKAHGTRPIRSTEAAPPALPAGSTTSSCGRPTIQKSR